MNKPELNEGEIYVVAAIINADALEAQQAELVSAKARIEELRRMAEGERWQG